MLIRSHVQAKYKILFFVFLFIGITLSSTPTYAASSCGINIDPQNPQGFPDSASIAGSEWVRIEFKDCTSGNDPTQTPLREVLGRYDTAFSDYVGKGIKILLIIDYQSYPNARENVNGFAERAAVIANYFASYGNSIAYEIWNEPDHPQGGFMSATEYGALLSATVDAMPESAFIVSAGLASGDPSWLRAAADAAGSSWSKVDGVGVHPYGKAPSSCSEFASTGSLESYIDDHYSAGGSKELWITELGMGTDQEVTQRDYMNCIYNYADGEAKIKNIIWFAWHNFRDFGIIRSDDTPKLSYSAYFQNACNASTPATGVVNQIPMPPMYEESGASCSPMGPDEDKRFISGRVFTSKAVSVPMPCPDGSTGCSSDVTNQPIRGVSITAYQGNAEFGTGFFEGKIGLKGQTVATDGQGRFKIETFLGGAPLNYTFLYFSCNNKGVDLWMIDVTQDVDGMDFYVDCEANYDRAFEGPTELDPVNRRDGILSCKLTEDNKYSTDLKFKEQGVEVKLEQPDSTLVGKPIDEVVNAIVHNIFEGVRLEGAVKHTSDQWCNAGLGQFFAGGPLFYHKCPLNKDVEASPELAQCGYWKECNDVVTDSEGSGRNMKRCGGLASNTMVGATNWQNLYALADLNTPVCLDPETSTPVKLKEVTPPWEASEEKYRDPNATPEAIAQRLGYKLSADYFPYGLLLAPSDAAVTDEAQYKFENDHYENDPPDVRSTPCSTRGDPNCPDKAFQVLDLRPQVSGDPGASINKLLEICLQSNNASSVCEYFNAQGYGGPAGMLFGLPGLSTHYDVTGEIDPTTILPPSEPRHFHIGYPINEFCACNTYQCEGEGITNNADVENVAGNYNNDWIPGYVVEGPGIGGAPAFQYEIYDTTMEPFLNRTIKAVINPILNIIYQLPGPLGTSCNPSDWGPAQCTSCVNDPNGFECRILTQGCPSACPGTCYQSKNIAAGYACAGKVSFNGMVHNWQWHAGEITTARNTTCAFGLPGDSQCLISDSTRLNSYVATAQQDGTGDGVKQENRGSINRDFLSANFNDPPVGSDAPAPGISQGPPTTPFPPGSGGPGCGLDSSLPDLATYFPAGFPTPITADYAAINGIIKNQVVDDSTNMTLAQVYASASAETGVPCEVLAGIHFIETGGTFKSPNGTYDASLLSGVSISTPEANVSCPGCTFSSVAESAIVAAQWLYGQMGSIPTTHEDLALALAKYYGWSDWNLNCGRSGNNMAQGYTGTCPPLYPGEDAMYAMNWVDQRHAVMIHRHPQSYGPFQRPGGLAIAIMFYLGN